MVLNGMIDGSSGKGMAACDETTKPKVILASAGRPCYIHEDERLARRCVGRSEPFRPRHPEILT